MVVLSRNYQWLKLPMVQAETSCPKLELMRVGCTDWRGFMNERALWMIDRCASVLVLFKDSISSWGPCSDVEMLLRFSGLFLFIAVVVQSVVDYWQAHRLIYRSTCVMKLAAYRRFLPGCAETAVCWVSGKRIRHSGRGVVTRYDGARTSPPKFLFVTELFVVTIFSALFVFLFFALESCPPYLGRFFILHSSIAAFNSATGSQTRSCCSHFLCLHRLQVG